ncbi:MAG: hypothetical protein AAGJ35_13820, partial [Myxococcota bacterium]
MNRKISTRASLALIGEPYRPLIDYPELSSVLNALHRSVEQVQDLFEETFEKAESGTMRVLFPDVHTKQSPSFSGLLEDVAFPRLFANLLSFNY